MNRKQRRAAKKNQPKTGKSRKPEAPKTVASAQNAVAAAAAHFRAGRLDEAEAAYQGIPDTDPGFADAVHMRGLIAHRRGDAGAAADLIGQAIILDDGAVAYHANLGVALRALGRLDDAISAYGRALDLQPDSVDAHYNMGNALRAKGQHENAVTHYLRAVEINPGHSEAHNNLAEAYRDTGKPKLAETHYRLALAAQPASAMAHSNLALLLRQQGHLTEALAHYGRALALDPNDGTRIKIATLLPPIMLSTEAIADTRRTLAQSITAFARDKLAIGDPLKEANTTTFFLAYHGVSDLELQRGLAGLYRRACPALQFTAPHCAGAPEQAGGRRVKVGFVSNKLKNHTIGRLNRGLIEHLSRESFEVSIFQFPHRPDPMSRAIQKGADNTVALPDDIAGARRRIAESELDILVYTDIGMDPIVYFLAFSRLAPVQCVTWGHPDTTGIDTIDYFVSSALMEPEGAEAHYSERLARLGPMSVYYYRPAAPDPSKGRTALGLDGESTLYVCPQSLFKFHPDFDPMLAAILRGDPKGELILVEGQHENWSRLFLERFGAGAPDVMNRVRFLAPLPHEDFMGLLGAADVLLDTPHFCGGNTSYEALALGTPIVTLPGAFMRGRITLALYRQMNMTDCIANDAEDYVAIATELGTDADRRRQLRERILDRSGALFEDMEAVSAWEAFFLASMKEAKGDTPAR
jgi:protein O-GlcNAc transferase